MALTKSDQKISPISLGAWSFSHHSRDDGAVYSNKFSVNNAAILNFHVVQWADGSSWPSLELGYLLVNKNYLGEVLTSMIIRFQEMDTLHFNTILFNDYYVFYELVIILIFFKIRNTSFGKGGVCV